MFEWFQKPYNAGTEAKRSAGPERTRLQVLLRILFSVTGLSGVLLLLMTWVGTSYGYLAMILGGTVFYLILAYHLEPQPDPNTGRFFPEAIDPHRELEDRLRWVLILLDLILIPGKLVCNSFTELIVLIQNATSDNP